MDTEWSDMPKMMAGVATLERANRSPIGQDLNDE
jgi:hypothetical protein